MAFCSTPVWGRVTLARVVNDGSSCHLSQSIAMMRASGPVDPSAPCVFYADDEPYADPLDIRFDSISSPGSAEIHAVALATTVTTSKGEIGDDYTHEVFRLGSRFCLVVASEHREFDLAHLENVRYEFPLPDDWLYTDGSCYVCHKMHGSVRAIACDHCGKSACVSHFALPFVKSSLHGVRVVEIRCARCAQMSGTCDMVVCDYVVKNKLRLNTSLLKLSPLYVHPKYPGVSNSGLFLVKQIEDELTGDVDEWYGPVDACVQEMMDMLKQSRVYHQKRGKDVIDIKLGNVARTQDGTWKIIDLGSVTDSFAAKFSSTYHSPMCQATCRALGINRDVHTGMLHFNDDMTVRVRTLANELLAETGYLVMLSTLLFGESEIGRLYDGVQAFGSGEGFLMQAHHESMPNRTELHHGGALFETGRLYTETARSVLDRMHFIFNSQQHTVAAQKVKLLADSIPSLSMSPDNRPAVSPEKSRDVSPDNRPAVSPEKSRDVSPDNRPAVSPEERRAVSFVG